MKITLIINEQHTLLPEQKSVLTDLYGSWETLLVPANGWNKEERDEICKSLSGTVIFASPIPGMIKRLSLDMAINNLTAQLGNHDAGAVSNVTDVRVFSNDNREKKELPNGKVISVVAKTGWYLE